MSPHFIFPKPRDWDTLEDIVCDVFARKFGNYNFQRYGRSGQSQSGVDIAGLTRNGLLGIQCKHHPTGNIPIGEIDTEITTSEGFRPELDEFIIATSADRDANAHGHVLQVSGNRTAKGRYPVAIKFWQDIYDWLVEFPDLVYKHFTRYFPVQELEDLRLPGLEESTKTTVQWPTAPEALIDAVSETIGRIDRAGPYSLAIGLSTFPEVTFDRKVDLEIPLTGLFSNEDVSEQDFTRASEIFNAVKVFIRDPRFSRDMLIHLQVRLVPAFLFGWVFRRVSSFNLRLVSGGQVWATNGLPLVPSKLTEGLPKLLNRNSTEVVLILNISRDIGSSVLEFVDTWADQPKAILTSDLENRVITSAAHALSISIDISQKIKAIIDKWGTRKIHLFGALPATLATLISFHLNAICPISIYFMSNTRDEYKLGGTLLNNL